MKMASFFIDLGVAFGALYLLLFVPAFLIKTKTKMSLPFGYQKTIAIIAGAIALLYNLNKHLG